MSIELLHVTKIEVTNPAIEPPVTTRLSPTKDICIDGVPIPQDLGITIQGETGYVTRLLINDAEVMYPTELWIDGVLRIRDEGWLSGNRHKVTVYP